MQDLNTFNESDDQYVGDAVSAIIWAVLGFPLLGILDAGMFAVRPWLVIPFSALFFVATTAVALASPRWRPIGAGLAFAAGVSTPFMFFAMVGGAG